MALFIHLHMPMKPLNFPEYEFRYRNEYGRKQIFDEFRRKYVALTPEEWVRQNVLKWLVESKKYPVGLLSVEAALGTGTFTRRTDAVFYHQNATPLMVIECKAPEVRITQQVFDQIARYNYPLKCDAMLVTNGISHYCCILDYRKMSYKFLEEIPDWESLKRFSDHGLIA